MSGERSWQVSAVAFRIREMSDGAAIARTFTVTVDGGERFGPFPAGPDPVELQFKGRLVRFDVAESTGGYFGGVEVQAYANRLRLKPGGPHRLKYGPREECCGLSPPGSDSRDLLCGRRSAGVVGWLGGRGRSRGRGSRRRSRFPVGERRVGPLTR